MYVRANSISQWWKGQNYKGKKIKFQVFTDADFATNHQCAHYEMETHLPNKSWHGEHWRLFVLMATFCFAITCGNMAPSNNSNNRYMWTEEETKIFLGLIDEKYHITKLDINLPGCTLPWRPLVLHQFVTSTSSTFYSSPVRVFCQCHRLLKRRFCVFTANFQKICFRLRWEASPQPGSEAKIFLLRGES